MKSKKINKKAVIFTIISLVISAIIISAFFFTQSTRLDSGVSNTMLRVNSINSFISQAEELAAYSAGVETRKALENMTEEMINRNDYYFPSPQPNRFKLKLKECLTTGTARFTGGGGPIQSTHNCNANLTKQLEDFSNFSKENLDMDITFKINDIDFNQIGPWIIFTEANITITVNDTFAFWNITKILTGSTSIIGLKDPTHWIDPLTFYRQIKIVERDEMVGTWDRYTSTLNLYGVSGKYFQYDKAPNFLNRLNGDLSEEDTGSGIASIVLYKDENHPRISNLDYAFLRRTGCTGSDTNRMITFNFSSLPIEERTRLNLSSDLDNSIHNTIYPDTFVTLTNMSDNTYYGTVVNC